MVRKPFSWARKPFSRGAKHFFGAAKEFSQGAKLFYGGAKEFSQGGKMFHGGAKRFSRSAKHFSQGRKPFPWAEKPFSWARKSFPQGRKPFSGEAETKEEGGIRKEEGGRGRDEEGKEKDEKSGRLSAISSPGPTGPEAQNSGTNDLIPSLAFTILWGSTPQGVLPQSVSGCSRASAKRASFNSRRITVLEAPLHQSDRNPIWATPPRDPAVSNIQVFDSPGNRPWLYPDP